MVALWVVARLSSAAGWQQTWAPPFAAYEWTTLGGGAAASLRKLIGIVHGEAFGRSRLVERHVSRDETHGIERQRRPPVLQNLRRCQLNGVVSA